MSAAPRFPRELGYAGLRMTADEYLALGETAERYELVDGVVFMSPSPWANHNEMIAEIMVQMGIFDPKRTLLRMFPDTDLRLNLARVYRPDLSVYRAGRVMGSIKQLKIPPDLVVEVLSESTKALDLITKRADYESFGVGEYWVLDPSDASVRQFARPAEGAPFEQQEPGAGVVRSAALPGFTLDLAPLKAIAG